MKAKIRNSVFKRFKITKTGKVLRGRQHGRHLKHNKSKTQIRRHKEPGHLTGKFARKIKNVLY